MLNAPPGSSPRLPLLVMVILTLWGVLLAAGVAPGQTLPGTGEVPRQVSQEPEKPGGAPSGAEQPESAWSLQQLWAKVNALFEGVPHLLLIFLFLCFLCLLEGVFFFLTDTDRLHRRRLKKRLDYLEKVENRAPSGSLLKIQHYSAIPWLQGMLKKVRQLERLQTLLMRADLNCPVGVFVLLVFLLGAVGLSLGFFQWGVMGAALGLAGGLGLPFLFLRLKKKYRFRKFEKQLPDALDLLARSLKAGHSFASGLQMMAEEMPNPLGLEFFKTFREYSHGLDVSSALANLCRRVNLKELRFFAMSVMIQRETGGNLTDILEKISHLIRERFKLRNQIKALSAEGRLSGWILILMPPVLFLVMLQLNPEYALTLTRHETGRKMALVALFFQALGVLAIRRIVNIKV